MCPALVMSSMQPVQQLRWPHGNNTTSATASSQICPYTHHVKAAHPATHNAARHHVVPTYPAQPALYHRVQSLVQPAQRLVLPKHQLPQRVSIHATDGFLCELADQLLGRRQQLLVATHVHCGSYWRRCRHQRRVSRAAAASTSRVAASRHRGDGSWRSPRVTGTSMPLPGLAVRRQLERRRLHATRPAVPCRQPRRCDGWAVLACAGVTH